MRSIALDALDGVHGGFRPEDYRQSENVEDYRPQSQGGPVPDEEWQREQTSYDNSCYIGADGHQYEGDPSGGEPTQVDPDE